MKSCAHYIYISVWKNKIKVSQFINCLWQIKAIMCLMELITLKCHCRNIKLLELVESSWKIIFLMWYIQCCVVRPPYKYKVSHLEKISLLFVKSRIVTRWKVDTVRTLIYCVVLVAFKFKVDTVIWYLFVFPFHCAAEIILKGSLFGKLVFLSPTELVFKLGETYKIKLTHKTNGQIY